MLPSRETSDAGTVRIRRLAVVCLVATVLMSSTGHAQGTTGTIRTVLKSGLHSFFEGHAPLVTVAEVGAAGSVSNVRIEFRDDSDRLVAAIDGVLARGRPVRLSMAIKGGSGLVQVRAIVRIETLADAGSTPMTVFEDIGPDSLSARIIVCGPPAQKGGGQEMCPGWHLTAAVE